MPSMILVFANLLVLSRAHYVSPLKIRGWGGGILVSLGIPLCLRPCWRRRPTSCFTISLEPMGRISQNLHGCVIGKNLRAH